MPFLRIETPASLPPPTRTAIGQLVHAAPAGDRFQVITAHPPEAKGISPLSLGIRKSPDAILTRITLDDGRTPARKAALDRAVADALRREACSCGNGEAQQL